MSVSLGRFRAGGNLRAHGSALLVIALWSATYVLTKIALAEMGPISLALFRNGVATIVLVI